MIDTIKEFIADVFVNMPWLGIIIVAMIPIIELRGAVPFALSTQLWGAGVLPWWKAYICAVIGSTIPALIIVPLLIPVFNWMKTTKFFKKIAIFFDEHFKKKSSSLANKVDNADELKRKERVKFWGVVTFVAIPLPLTGAWTGSAVAAYLGMGFKKGVLAVLIGNLISGAIMTLLCTIFSGYENLIIDLFLWLALAIIVGTIIYGAIKIIFKQKSVKENITK